MNVFFTKDSNLKKKKIFFFGGGGEGGGGDWGCGGRWRLRGGLV